MKGTDKRRQQRGSVPPKPSNALCRTRKVHYCCVFGMCLLIPSVLLKIVRHYPKTLYILSNQVTHAELNTFANATIGCESKKIKKTNTNYYIIKLIN